MKLPQLLWLHSAYLGKPSLPSAGHKPNTISLNNEKIPKRCKLMFTKSVPVEYVHLKTNASISIPKCGKKNVWHRGLSVRAFLVDGVEQKRRSD